MKFDFSTEMLEPRRLLSAGDLDPSFGAHGLVLNPLSGDTIAGVVPLADGKLMIANTVGAAGKGDFQVARLTASGQLDKSFGKNGKLIIDFGGDDQLDRIIPTIGGKVLLVGTTGPNSVAIARIDQNGSLDHSFSGDGKATFDQKQPTTIENASADSSGRVKLALGTTSLRQFREVFAITGSGSTDSGFGEKGHLTVAAILEKAHLTGPQIQDALLDAVVTPDGELTLGGSDYRPNYSDPLPLLVRLKPNGKLQTSFGDDGTLIDPIQADNWIPHLQAAPDNSVFAWFHNSGITHEDLVRVSSRGAIVGRFLYPVQFQAEGNDPDINFETLAFQTDGKVIGVGEFEQYASSALSDGLFLSRYSSSGERDYTFGTNGLSVVSSVAFAGGVAIDRSGRIVVNGGTSFSADQSRSFVARIEATPRVAPLAKLSTSGTLTVNGVELGDTITVSLADGGKTIVADANGETASFKASLVKRIVVNGRGGGDTITNFVALPATLNGGAGDDSLIGSQASDLFQGGSGFDTVDYSARTENLVISKDNQANDGAVGEHDNVQADVETVIGGAGNDLIIGSPFADVLYGGGGNDTLWGGAGDDFLVGGPGHDLLFGQDGDDTLSSDDGESDTLDGGAGTDTAFIDQPPIVDQLSNVESTFF